MLEATALQFCLKWIMLKHRELNCSERKLFQDCSKNISIFHFFPYFAESKQHLIECAKEVQSNAPLHLLLKAFMDFRHCKTF